MTAAPADPGPLERLRALCRATGVLDIAGAALALAKVRKPEIDLAPYEQHLKTLVDSTADLVRRRRPAPEALREVLAARYGYRGDQDTYDDLQNADLARVIDRRKGLPVALSILYIHVARAQDWACEGLAFPGHFLIRLDGGGGRWVLDPFHEGAVREAGQMRELLKGSLGPDAELRPDFFDAVSDRDVLLRLENNIRTRMMKNQDAEGATDALERMLAIAPERADLLYERGMMAAAGDGPPRRGIEALERLLALGPDAGAPESMRRRAAEALQDLRRRLN
jgi:regulator of sirC expression with transglutaminase-like and TPR domain